MELLPYIVGAQMLVFAVVGFVILYHYKIKQRLIAQFFRTVQTGSMGARVVQKIGQKDFNAQAETVRFNKHTFPIKFQKMAFQEGNKKVWCFDLDEDLGLNFGGHFELGDTTFMDNVLESGILKQFVQFAGKLDIMSYIIIALFVVVAVLGFVSGVFSSPYILGSGAP